jgi:amino acid adenylation domain-containing protein
MWVLHQLQPGLTAYHVRFLFRLKGKLIVPALERAINAVVSRHEILRTVFPAEEGLPQQVVLPFRAEPLPVIDFTQLSEREAEQGVHQFAKDAAAVPFDLARPPLLRLTLIEAGETSHYLIVIAHHTIFDAWSRQIFLHEVSLAYNAFIGGTIPALPELPIQFSDYALWQREMLQGEALNRLTSHWKGQFSGELPVLDLAFDRSRPPVQTYHGKRLHGEFDSEESARLRSFCQNERITLFMLMLAALDVLLRGYSGMEDITVGCPFADRGRRELDGLIGMLLNTLPVRVDLSGNPTFRELLDRTRKVVLEAFNFQALPFDKLVAEINPVRDLSRTPIFQVLLNMAHIPKRHSEMQGVLIDDLFFENAPAAFDLEVEILDRDEEIECTFRYNTDLFGEATIQRMLAHFRTILSKGMTRPKTRLSELGLLSPAERQLILIDWNDNQAGLPVEGCIHEMVEKQVERTPEATAVVFNAERVSYGEINRRSNQLAHHLRSKGVGTETLVGIFLNRSVEMLVAQLAVFKAGGAYVPFDPNHPPDRIRRMLADANPALLITSESLSAGLPFSQPALIRIDVDRKAIADCSPANVGLPASPDDLAYVMYTSGSSGLPKGVMVPHRGVVNYLLHMISAHGLGPADRILQFTSLAFDPSVRDTVGVLTFGGCVILMDDTKMVDPGAWLAAIDQQDVTAILSIVPSMLTILTAAARQSAFRTRSLRLLMVSGEALPQAEARAAREVFGDRVRLVNQYGPTECSMIATTHVVDPADLTGAVAGVPIGKPIPRVRAHVLDHDLNPVPIGVKGDLYIGGVGVGRGYLNRPDLTAERFLPDPLGGLPPGRLYKTGDLARYRPDGILEFLGRSDLQVKIHGNRVELGEIESVLRQHPSVGEAVVVLSEDSSLGSRLAAYFVPRDPALASVQVLREYLTERLPAYMIPFYFIPLPALPLTPNRKVDRRALPPPASESTEPKVAPRTRSERVLAGLWQEVLPIAQPGVMENFFDLGGDSLRAVQLLVRINTRLGLNLSLHDVFDAPSIAMLAERIDRLMK